MKIAAAAMAIALIVLVLVAMNMESPPKKVELAPGELPKPEMAAMGGDLSNAQSDFRPQNIVGMALPAISDVQSVSSEEASETLSESELVLGVVVNGQARAYPLGRMAGMNRSVVNDELGGKSIAVTWDDESLCGTVFHRKVGGEQSSLVVFQPSGQTWRSNTVLQDRDSESLWSQMTAQCESGQMKGLKLVSIPSVLVSWKGWKSDFPESTVMKPVSENTVTPVDSSKLDSANQLVVGVVGYKLQVHFRRDRLMKHPVINHVLGKKSLVVFTDTSTHAVRAYDSKVDGKTLEFRQEGETVTDKQTSSQWDLKSGQCLSGKLAGKSLKRIATVPAKQSTWKEFYARSKEWLPDNG